MEEDETWDGDFMDDDILTNFLGHKSTSKVESLDPVKTDSDWLSNYQPVLTQYYLQQGGDDYYMDHLRVRGDSEDLPNIGLEELETKEHHQHESNFTPTFGNPFPIDNDDWIDQKFLGDYVTNVEEEDWVEDWDEDLDIYSYPTKKPQFSQRSNSPGGMRHFPADQSNDSLLEFLESAVRENMFPDKEGDIAVNLELKKHEFHNQRLKGLTEWLKNTSEVLHSTVSTDNSNDECNSRLMMEQEFQQRYPDVNVVERTVEKCEVEPTKESCISYLEIVIKWIRGACHIFSNALSRNGKPSPEVITRDKIDSLFLRCDYILHEQSRETRSRILECLKIWRDKFDLLDESAGTFVSNFLNLLRLQLSLCRIQLQLIEVKIHISSGDNLNSQLECLETIMEKLVLLDEWLNFYHCHQRLHHVEDLPILLLELKAVCLSDKMLILANLSPISMQNLVKWNLSAPAHTRTENSSCYNVVYESNIGSLFVHLMVCLESPSIVRSRLAFAGCCYIQALLKDELPWQSGKYMMVVRVKHDVENLVDPTPADFGVQEVDIQYSTNDFSPTDFERNIIDMFSQSLGSIDESKNLQVLLFESVTDLFPTPKKLKEISHFLSYPNSSVFPHITGSLDLDLSFEVRQNGQTISRGCGFIPSNNIDEVVMGGHNSHYSNYADIHRSANGASALMKHELYLYSFSLLPQFVNFISDSYPSITVELLDLCCIILAHLNLSDISQKFHKQAFLLAIRCGDCDSAIKHGNILWSVLLHSQDIATNIPNFVHTAELLGEQFAANAQYELAIKVYSNAARICFDLMRRESTTSRISNKRLINKQNKYFHCKVEGFLLNLGKSYLDFGHMHGAINIFKRLLMDYSSKIDSPNNDDRIIVFLSWILQGFYDLHDFDSCRRTISVIKEVRKRNIHKPLDQMSSSGMERNSKSLGMINNDNQNRIACTTYHYLKNNSKGYLPQYVLNAHNIDLGVILSKIYYHTGQFVSALHALTPAIICTEMMVGGKYGAKEGVLQLADLYYLRGEIELAACRSAQSLTYPFEIGSSHHFASVQLLCAEAFSTSSMHGFDRNLYKKHSLKERESGIKEANRRSHVSPVGFGEAHGFRNKGTHQLHVFTCRRGATYNDGADLLWDAIRWFRRAWDFFHTAGDEVNAANSANRIAECNLLPIFVPHVFFGVPLQVALDLSNFDQEGINSRSDGLPQTRSRYYHHVNPVTERQDDSTIRRFVSLGEVARITSFAYEIHLESSLPIELMESFMNLAELNLVTGEVAQALTFWWEARDLFLFIFSDGSLIPHLRRSTQSEIQKLKDLLDRIVRFLWKCEESVRNSHLILLEIHNIFGIELLRACRRDAQRSRTVAQRLIGAFKSLIKKSKVNAQNPLPMEKSDASNVGGETNAVTQKRSFFFHLCGCGGAKQNIDVVDPKRPAATSKLIRASKHQDLDPIRKYTHEVFTRGVRQLIEELTRISKQPISIFSWTLNDETVLEKMMDFGWSNLIDYSLPCSSMKEPFTSAQDYIESKSQQISISKYAKIPSFLLTHILDFYELRDPYVSDVDDDSTSSSSSFGGGNRSKLGTELDDRRPLDPFYDFQWMRESFAMSYVKPLLNNHIGVNPSFVVLPELSQIIKMEWFAENLTFEVAQQTIQKNSFHEQVAHKSEKVLIQRVWSLFAKIKNSCFLYRNQKINLAGLKRQVRLSLRCVALNMLRLRAFSRQFKSSLFDYDVLTSMLQQHADFNQESKSSLLFNPPKHVIEKFRPIKLQERLPQAVYVHYIDKVVFTYNPFSGSDHVEMLGENVCTKFSRGVAGQLNNREVSFSSKEISLMFALCTKSKDHECGSGPMERLRVASLMKQGALAGSINFLRTFGQFVGGPSGGENLLLENSTGNEDNIRKIGNINNKSIVKSLYFQGEPQILGVTASENRRHSKHDNSVGFRGHNAILRNAVGSNQNQEAPFHGSPLTLFCSIPSYIIPWELLLEDCCVVRAFGLSSLLVQILDPICDGKQQQTNENQQTFASQNLGSSGLVQKHAFKGHLGPRLNQAPLFFTTIYGITEERSIEMQLFQRKAKAALYMIDKTNHNYNSVFREEEFWKQKIQTNMDKTTRHNEKNEFVRDFSFPLPLTASTFRNELLSKQSLFALQLASDTRGPGVAQFWSQVDKKLQEAQPSGPSNRPLNTRTTLSRSFFPVILFSYCDLVDLSDAVIAATCMLRRDSIFIFVHPCIQDKLVEELNGALLLWCGFDFQSSKANLHLVHNNYFSSAQQPNEGNWPATTVIDCTGSEDSTSKSLQQTSNESVGGHPPQMHFTTLSNKTFIESDIKQSTDCTWAYHIVMDVVQKIQRDHAIPIPVIV